MRSSPTPPFLSALDGDEGGSAFKDPAFAQNKGIPVHRWVPWIAGFSAGFVRNAVEQRLSTPGVVLDPFCGVGTTLVEAVLLGHQAIGFEINPYAAFVTRVKLQASQIRIEHLRAAIRSFQIFYQEKVSSDYQPLSSPPKGFKTRAPFYSPKVLRKVLIVLDYINQLSEKEIRAVFQVAFASTMVRYSNYSYEPSLGRRASSGKPDILDFPVGELITAKLEEIHRDILWFQEHLPNSKIKYALFQSSFLKYEHYLSPASVDLIITSPPYLNNYHYNRNTRPQLYWLGFVESPQDLKALEVENFGKYWQTVRGLQPMELKFTLPNSDLDDRLSALREANAHKGVYGGQGWANYAVSYFNDCYLFAKGIQYVLKPGGEALVVLGNSILQGIEFPTDRYFAEIAEHVGLKVETIETPRSTRVGNSIIRSDVRSAKAKRSHRLYESVVVVKKP